MENIRKDGFIEIDQIRDKTSSELRKNSQQVYQKLAGADFQTTCNFARQGLDSAQDDQFQQDLTKLKRLAGLMGQWDEDNYVSWDQFEPKIREKAYEYHLNGSTGEVSDYNLAVGNRYDQAQAVREVFREITQRISDLKPITEEQKQLSAYLLAEKIRKNPNSSGILSADRFANDQAWNKAVYETAAGILEADLLKEIQALASINIEQQIYLKALEIYQRRVTRTDAETVSKQGITEAPKGNDDQKALPDVVEETKDEGSITRRPVPSPEAVAAAGNKLILARDGYIRARKQARGLARSLINRIKGVRVVDENVAVLRRDYELARREYLSQRTLAEVHNEEGFKEIQTDPKALEGYYRRLSDTAAGLSLSLDKDFVDKEFTENRTSGQEKRFAQWYKHPFRRAALGFVPYLVGSGALILGAPVVGAGILIGGAVLRAGLGALGTEATMHAAQNFYARLRDRKTYSQESALGLDFATRARVIAAHYENRSILEGEKIDLTGPDSLSSLLYSDRARLAAEIRKSLSDPANNISEIVGADTLIKLLASERIYEAADQELIKQRRNRIMRVVGAVITSAIPGVMAVNEIVGSRVATSAQTLSRDDHPKIGGADIPEKPLPPRDSGELVLPKPENTIVPTVPQTLSTSDHPKVGGADIPTGPELVNPGVEAAAKTTVSYSFGGRDWYFGDVHQAKDGAVSSIKGLSESLLGKHGFNMSDVNPLNPQAMDEFWGKFSKDAERNRFRVYQIIKAVMEANPPGSVFIGETFENFNNDVLVKHFTTQEGHYQPDGSAVGTLAIYQLPSASRVREILAEADNQFLALKQAGKTIPTISDLKPLVTLN